MDETCHLTYLALLVTPDYSIDRLSNEMYLQLDYMSIIDHVTTQPSKQTFALHGCS